MARNISAASLAKLATQYGTEPINIIEVQWVPNGQRVSYSDRDIEPGIKGKVLDVSGLDNVINILGGSQSQQITITLDDTDGTIKETMDCYDIHKRPCWVYQWFDGIDVSEKFLIFKGQISSPITWDEGARTITFDVINKLEDTEVGFSIEEGDFPNPPENLLGKPWPLCFGTCINVPALQAKSVRQGTLATGVGIKDFQLSKQLTAAQNIVCPLNFVGFKVTQTSGTLGWGAGQVSIKPSYAIDANCQKSRCEAIETAELQIDEQSDFEFSTFKVFGGDQFPQGVEITLDIDGGKFTGSFAGEIFTVTSRQHPKLGSNGKLIIPPPVQTVESECGTDNDLTGGLTNGAFGSSQTLFALDSKRTWDIYNAIEPAGFFWANPGATVTLDDDQEIIYIANILPSTILRVAAFRNVDSGRKLLTVPESFYTVRQTDYNSYQVMEIVFEEPLSTREQGWEDDIYVTLTSTVGPNTVDILEWFIDIYTDLTVDSTSFDAVKTQIEPYPSHFPLLVRKNIIDVLQEIAFQSRCAIWLSDDVFYLKYLPATATATDTIGESDVLQNTMQVTHTSTEELVTKYTAEWKKDYAIDDPNRLILRHNVSKYGTQEETYNFYIYNILELVRKSATFWLIRKSNTWRKVRFNTPITKLKLEVFDTVDLTLPDVAAGTIQAIVEKGDYDSNDHNMVFELWTPVRSGEKIPYIFAYPAGIAQETFFPTLDERAAGFAGGGTGPNFSTIAPDAHPLSNVNPNLIQGFQFNGCTNFDFLSNESFPTCRPDFGDLRPSDINDQKPVPDASTDQAGEISGGVDPIGDTFGYPSDCCAQAREALNRADQAFQEAQQARSQAASAGDAGGLNDDRDDDVSNAKEELPDNGGEPGNCEWVAELQWIVVTNVTGGASPEVGQIIGFNETVKEFYTFNAHAAAREFRDAMVQLTLDISSAKQAVVGNEYPYVASTVNPSSITQIDSETGLACVTVPTEEQEMTAYSGDAPTNPDPAFTP
jgi:hypothetical protein